MFLPPPGAPLWINVFLEDILLLPSWLSMDEVNARRHTPFVKSSGWKDRNCGHVDPTAPPQASNCYTRFPAYPIIALIDDLWPPLYNVDVLS